MAKRPKGKNAGKSPFLSEERLRDFARSASDWFWETDEKFEFIMFSERVETIFDGLSPHLIGKTRWQLCQADIENDPHWKAHYQDHLCRRTFKDFRYSLPMPDGSFRDLRVSGVPFYNQGGEFCGYRGTARDETEISAAQLRANKAEILLNQAIGSMNDAFAIFDANDNLAHFNQAYATIMASLECPLEIGLSFQALCRSVAENGFGWVNEQAKEAWLNWRLERHRQCNGFEEYRVRDGRWFRADEKRLEGGETVVLVMDISILKNAQVDLEKANSKLEQKVSARTIALQKKNKLLKDQIRRRTDAEREYRQIFEHTPVGIYRTSPEGRFIRANPALVALSGYHNEAQMIDAIQDIATDWYIDETARELFLSEIMESGRVVDLASAIKYRDSGREVAISESAVAIRGNNGEIAYFEGTVQNITAHLETQKNLETVTQEAIMANRAKSSFLAQMSHELRTPLNAILGFSETMQLAIFGPIGSERYEDYLSNIHTSAAHLLSLINDILDLAKIEEGHSELYEEIIDISTLLHEVAEFVAPDVRAKEIDISLNVTKDLPDLYCDERKIKQIMINLVSNAVKFTPQGGEIVIGAHFGLRKRLCLSVSDTGPGIPEDEQERILEPFARARQTREDAIPGTGLGLALVNALAEEHDAKFTLTSIPGMGTTTRVTFPSYRTRQCYSDLADKNVVAL